MACLFGHKWKGCQCERCGKTRDEEHDWDLCKGVCKRCGKTQPAKHVWDGKTCKHCGAPNPNMFYLKVSNKYTAYGGIYAEGPMEYGQLSIGDRVYVYGENGRLKYDGIKVIALNNEKGIRTNTVKMGDGKYAAIRLDGIQNIGDIEYNDMISRAKLKLEVQTQEAPPAEEKVLPQAKTYNHADRRTHIHMATNDIASLSASGSLAAKRDWVRDVGQDLYDAHGFDAMQEVFINVKTRYPAAQGQLSSIWDGVGGWAD